MGSVNAPIALVWFRLDLRLIDNPALTAALRGGGQVLPVFILDDTSPGDWRTGGASRWWLDGSLRSLARSFEDRGSQLILRRGPALTILDALIEETGATTVHWNRQYEPWAKIRDTAIKASLKKRGLTVESHQAALLFEPWTIQTKTGGPYKVFTPFSRGCFAKAAEMGVGAILPAPETLPAIPQQITSDRLEDWDLLPTKPDWAGGLRDTWRPGEAGAADRLAIFLDRAATSYGTERNRPDRPGTSSLSPHLHWGEIGPRQVWSATQARLDAGSLTGGEEGARIFLTEILWREFAHNLLFHFPSLPEAPLDQRFAKMPWAEDYETDLRRWQAGQTGYPIVDAGMRQLYETGWMHNRVRMIVASFLIKHLMIPWQAGQAWFWDTLVDASLASNSASWQWVAGCGADAAPYFRIFNPVTQGEKFDPDGAYVRHWVPELRNLPAKFIHQPWSAPPLTLQGANITLGATYPAPMVDHKTARQRALDAYAIVKQAA